MRSLLRWFYDEFLDDTSPTARNVALALSGIILTVAVGFGGIPAIFTTVIDLFLTLSLIFLA